MAAILVVDDNPVVRTIFAQTLRRKGHVLHLAGDGKQALCILAHELVELVITDMWMPGITGMDLVRHLAGAAQRPRIIVATGDPQALEAYEERHLIDGVLTKPINLIDLNALVTRLFRPETAAPSEAT